MQVQSGQDMHETLQSKYFFQNHYIQPPDFIYFLINSLLDRGGNNLSFICSGMNKSLLLEDQNILVNAYQGQGLKKCNRTNSIPRGAQTINVNLSILFKHSINKIIKLHIELHLFMSQDHHKVYFLDYRIQNRFKQNPVTLKKHSRTSSISRGTNYFVHFVSRNERGRKAFKKLRQIKILRHGEKLQCKFRGKMSYKLKH